MLGAEDTVRAYKDLAKVERAFRCLKTVHRFRGLLEHLATLTKNTIQPAGDLPPFDRLTVPTPLQQKAFDLLEVSIPV